MQVFKSPKESLGDLGALSAAKLIAAATDVAVIVDGKGVIRDVAFNKEDLSLELDAQGRWLGSKLAEIVTPETSAKVKELLQDAATPKIVDLAPGQPSVARRRRYSGAVFGRSISDATIALSWSVATCGRLRRCSSGWSTPSNRWSATMSGCVMPKRAIGCCSRYRRKRS